MGAIVSWITAVDGRVAYVRKILRIYFNKNFCNAAEFVTVVSSGGHESSAPHVLEAGAERQKTQKSPWPLCSPFALYLFLPCLLPEI